MTEDGDANEVPRQEFKVDMPEAVRAGVWANLAMVGHSPYEFTLDFVRLDFAQQRGIGVARVSLSPLLVMQLKRCRTLQQVGAESDATGGARP